jgi:hypothetical protein
MIGSHVIPKLGSSSLPCVRTPNILLCSLTSPVYRYGLLEFQLCRTGSYDESHREATGTRPVESDSDFCY